MKKNLIFLAIAFLVSLTSFSQDVSGVYNTDYKQMTLDQIGNKVTGTYEGANGKIQAILNGNRLVGTWRNSASGKTGNFEFIFNSDYSSFTGKYGYNNNGPTKKWNGTKVKSTNSANIINTSQASIANIAGIYRTDFNDMTLSVNGNRVTGTYKHRDGKIDGVLTNNKLVGIWTQSNGKGNFEFIFNSDFSSFTGKWGYNNSTPTSKWNGTKLKSTGSTTVVSIPTITIPNIAGEYNTDYGKMTLNQNEDRVTGIYESGNGTVIGTVEGNRLFGTWKNSSNSKTGKFEFIFNGDFSEFTGKFGYNSDTPTRKWNGTRVKSASSTSIIKTPEVAIANIAGIYKTDFNDMTLTINGNRVTGTYKHNEGKIEGVLTNNKLVGTWTQTNGKGNFEFNFNSDFSAFTGKWGYNNSVPNSKWNGTKTSSLGNATIPTLTDIPINVYGSWAHRGNKNQDDRLNIWQEGNKFVVIISWIDINTKIWKSYKGEGQFEGRQMNFKVFPSVINGETIDQGYMYHYTVSSDNNLITGYYTRYGERNPDANWYYQRVTE